MIILLCGLSGAGKTTLAKAVKQKLAEADVFIELIDADEYRQQLFKDLLYSKEDRNENIRRLGVIANKFSSHNIITIISAINPYDDIRMELVKTYKNVKIVHIDCPLPVLVKRDTKGLYKRALLPTGDPQKINNLTGINDPFEAPANPNLYINTYDLTVNESVDELYSFIMENRYPLKKSVNHY
ncbi:MAG: cysC [Mucilaginibacter sp.]|nr:cysC [Mucilaginibacter sp.]